MCLAQRLELGHAAADKPGRLTTRIFCRNRNGVLVNVQANEHSDIVFHGLPPETSFADQACRPSAYGYTHSCAQPTIRSESDHLQIPSYCGPFGLTAG